MHSELEFERLYLVQDVFKNKLNAKIMCSVDTIRTAI